MSNGMDVIFLQEENAELKRNFARLRHDVFEALEEIDEDYDSAIETLKAVAKFDENATPTPGNSEAVLRLLDEAQLIQRHLENISEHADNLESAVKAYGIFDSETAIGNSLLALTVARQAYSNTLKQFSAERPE